MNTKSCPSIQKMQLTMKLTKSFASSADEDSFTMQSSLLDDETYDDKTYDRSFLSESAQPKDLFSFLDAQPCGAIGNLLGNQSLEDVDSSYGDWSAFEESTLESRTVGDSTMMQSKGSILSGSLATTSSALGRRRHRWEVSSLEATEAGGEKGGQAPSVCEKGTSPPSTDCSPETGKSAQEITKDIVDFERIRSKRGTVKGVSLKSNDLSTRRTRGRPPIAPRGSQPVTAPSAIGKTNESSEVSVCSAKTMLRVNSKNEKDPEQPGQQQDCSSGKPATSSQEGSVKAIIASIREKALPGKISPVQASDRGESTEVDLASTAQNMVEDQKEPVSGDLVSHELGQDEDKGQTSTRTSSPHEAGDEVEESSQSDEVSLAGTKSSRESHKSPSSIQDFPYADEPKSYLEHFAGLISCRAASCQTPSAEKTPSIVVPDVIMPRAEDVSVGELSTKTLNLRLQQDHQNSKFGTSPDSYKSPSSMEDKRTFRDATDAAMAIQAARDIVSGRKGNFVCDNSIGTGSTRSEF